MRPWSRSPRPAGARPSRSPPWAARSSGGRPEPAGSQAACPGGRRGPAKRFITAQRRAMLAPVHQAPRVSSSLIETIQDVNRPLTL
jgi:hypothetical protein